MGAGTSGAVLLADEADPYTPTSIARHDGEQHDPDRVAHGIEDEPLGIRRRNVATDLPACAAGPW